MDRTIKIVLLMVLIVGLLLIALAIANTANAASKTPKTRVGEAFSDFRLRMPKTRVGEVFRNMPRQTPKLRLPPSSSRYLFDHDIWHTPGKAIIHKECAYNFRNDPGEASCQTVWAHI